MTEDLHSIVATNYISTHDRPSSKAKAYQALEAMMSMVARGESPTDESLINELTTLFSYFQPKPSKTPKTAFEWVALAAASGKNATTSKVMSLVRVNDGYAVATDGYRIHRAPSALESGYYTTSGIRVECEGTYPNVEVLLDRIDNEVVVGDSFELSKDAAIEKIPVVWCGDIKLNQAYHSAAMSFKSTGTLCGSRVHGVDLKPGEALQFRFDDDRTAIVMPTRYINTPARPRT